MYLLPLAPTPLACPIVAPPLSPLSELERALLLDMFRDEGLTDPGPWAPGIIGIMIGIIIRIVMRIVIRIVTRIIMRIMRITMIRENDRGNHKNNCDKNNHEKKDKKL